MSDEEELPSPDVWLKTENGFPAPDWNWLIDWQKDKPDRTKDRFAIFVIDEWAEALRARGGSEYEIISSRHFLVVSGRPSREGDLLVSAMERALDRIAAQLPGVAYVRPVPKHAAILFGDHDLFLEYVSSFYPEEGEFGHPGGLFIPDGLGHFVLPADPIQFLEASITHELTHGLNRHLHLPGWIDEGLAEAMEFAAGLRPARIFDREAVEEHRAYWNAEHLKDFWSGASFTSVEGQHLSYSLAEFLIHALPGEAGRQTEFITHAKAADAGHEAARTILGIKLEDLIAPLVATPALPPEPAG